MDISTLTLLRSTITRNAAQFGGGGYVNKDSAVLLQQTATVANSAASNGGGWLVAVEASKLESAGGNITDNAAGARRLSVSVSVSRFTRG